MSIIGNYYNEKESFLVTQSEETKQELFFDFDGFSKPVVSTNLKTVANLIHSLLFLKKGTYPDCPNMGIDIEQFQFELIHDNTIKKIRLEIESQINEYIPTVYLRDLVVQKISNENISNGLGIGFDIAYNQQEDSGQFFIMLTENPDTRSLLNQIIY